MVLDGKLPPLPPRPPNFRDPLERDPPKPINIVVTQVLPVTQVAIVTDLGHLIQVTPTAAIPGEGYNEF